MTAQDFKAHSCLMLMLLLAIFQRHVISSDVIGYRLANSLLITYFSTKLNFFPRSQTARLPRFPTSPPPPRYRFPTENNGTPRPLHTLAYITGESRYWLSEKLLDDVTASRTTC